MNNIETSIRYLDAGVKSLINFLDVFYNSIDYPPLETYIEQNNIFTNYQNISKAIVISLCGAITSHLQTGSTLVLGPDEETVKLWVNTLYLFQQTRQQSITRLRVLVGPENYVPDLALQGLVCDRKQLESQQIFLSASPTTIIEIYTDKPPSIHQTHLFNHYKAIRKNLVEYYISLHTNEKKTLSLWDSVSLFRQVSPAYIILGIIDFIFVIPTNPHYVLTGCLYHIMRILLEKALVMERLFHNLKGKSDLKNTICHLLDLDIPSYNVLLGILDKFRPNFSDGILGTAEFIEERLLEVFENDD